MTQDTEREAMVAVINEWWGKDDVFYLYATEIADHLAAAGFRRAADVQAENVDKAIAFDMCAERSKRAEAAEARLAACVEVVSAARAVWVAYNNGEPLRDGPIHILRAALSALDAGGET